MKQKVLLILGIIFILIALGLGFWQINRVNRNLLSVNATERALNKLSKLMEFPDEIPTVATVVDKNQLGDEEFFRQAENGDFMVIFPTTKKAVLYRETSNKIIDVTTLAVEEKKGLKINKVSIKRAKVGVFNGSNKKGMASVVADEVLKGIDNLEVTTKQDAANNYNKTMVIDVSGKFTEVAQGLAEGFGAEIKELPEGEEKPEVDILIIVGED